MALETVTIVLDQTWQLISNAAAGRFTARVLDGGDALFSIGTVAPDAGSLLGFPTRELRFDALDAKVWARGAGIGASVSVVRTVDAGNPAIPSLGTLTLSGSTFTVGAVEGTEIGTFGGLGTGDVVESITPNDGRVVLNGAKTKLLVGMTAANAGTIRVRVRYANPKAPNSPKTAEFTITVGAAAPRLPSSNEVAALGDSRTLDNFRSGAITSEGPMSWARQLSKGRIRFLKANNSGVGGATTVDIRANQYPAIKASSAKILVLLAGVNDANTGDVTPAQTVANLKFMAEDFCASDPGRICVLLDEVPVSGLNKPAHQIATRDGVRLLHNPVAGVYVGPSWDAIATAANADTPQSWAYRDGIHWAKRGAFVVGRAIWNVLKTLVPAFDIFARPGVVGTGVFANSGGVPTGWAPTSLPTGITARTEVIDGVTWAFLTINAVTNLDFALYVSSGTTPAGFTPGTTDLDTLVAYRVAAGSQNLRFVSIEARRESGGVLVAKTGEQGTDGVDAGGTVSQSSGAFPPDAVDGVLQPPVLAFPAAATQLRTHWLRIVGLASQAASGEVGFALPQPRPVAA